MKLKTQFSLFSALLVTTVVGATTAGFYWKEKERIRHDFQQERFALARQVEIKSLDAVLSKDYSTLIRFLRQLKQNDPHILWAATHHAGEIVAHTENRWIGRTPGDENTLKSISANKIDEFFYDSNGVRVLEVATPIRSGSVRVGTARVAFSQELIRERYKVTLFNTMKRVFGVSLVILIFGVVVGILIAQNMTYRISRLAQAARSLAKGNFHEQIPQKGSDEIHELASEFNLMAKQLAELYGKVQEQADTLAQANLDLLEMDRIKKNFFSLVSHELRGPLTTVKGYLSILLEAQGMEDWPKQERQLIIIKEEAERITKMVNEFMDLSRIEAGTFHIDMKTVDLKILLEFIVDRVEPEAESHDIQFSIKMDESLSTFKGDGERLSQVILNLIGNSFKFTRSSGKIELEVYRIPKGRRAHDVEQIAFRVRDTGKGIPKEALDKIFDRYYQISGEEKKKGLGLGLAFAKEVIERHGGAIWAESEGVGHGTTMTFVLPLDGQLTLDNAQ